ISVLRASIRSPAASSKHFGTIEYDKLYITFWKWSGQIAATVGIVRKGGRSQPQHRQPAPHPAPQPNALRFAASGRSEAGHGRARIGRRRRTKTGDGAPGAPDRHGTETLPR